MSWLDKVTLFLGGVASGDPDLVKSLVSEDVKYRNGDTRFDGVDELIENCIGSPYKIQIINWAYKNKLVFIEYRYWDYQEIHHKEVVGVYTLNPIGNICNIRIYE